VRQVRKVTGLNKVADCHVKKIPIFLIDEWKERVVVNIELNTRRKFTRIHFDRQVKLDFIDESYYSRVENLSLTGMFIIGNFQKHQGKYCIIDLYKTGTSLMSLDLSLRASAEVVRKNEKGIAIRFISMPFDSCMFLKSTLPKPPEYPFIISDNVPISSETNIHFNN
jgi:hypothetical protein